MPVSISINTIITTNYGPPAHHAGIIRAEHVFTTYKALLSLISFSGQDAVVLCEGRPFQEALSCCPKGNHLSPLPFIRAGENVGPEGSEL